MSNTTVTPETLRRWDELTQAALVKTNPMVEQPIGVAMSRAEWIATCAIAMPALIAEVRQLMQRAEAAELSLKLIEADNRDLEDAHRRIGELERALADMQEGRTIDNAEGSEIIIGLRRQLATAEARLATALGADKPDKPATPTERARHWAMEAADQKRRAEKAEAKLSAIPVDAMLECIGPDDYEFTATGDAIEKFATWLEAQRIGALLNSRRL